MDPCISLISNRISDVNIDFIKFTGYSKEEIYGKEFAEVLRLLRIPLEITEKLDNEEAAECHLFTSTLETREVSLSISKGMKADKRNLYFREKPDSRLEKKLMLAVKLLSDNNSAVGIFSAPGYLLLDANHGFLDMLEAPFNQKDISLGCSLSRLSVTSSVGVRLEIWSEVAEKGISYYNEEIEIVKSTKHNNYLDISIVPIAENNKVKYIVFIAKNVSKKILNHKRDKEFYEYHKNLLQNASDIVIFTDEYFNIKSWNHTAELTFGWPQEAVLGKNIDILLQTWFVDMNIHDITLELAKNNHLEIESFYKSKKGNLINAVNNISILKNEKGGVKGYVRMIRDITDQKRTENLSFAMRHISELIYSTLNFDELMKRIMSEASKAINCKTAAISMRRAGKWVVSYVHGFTEDVIGFTTDDEREPHACTVLKTKKPFVIVDAMHDEYTDKVHMNLWGIYSVLIIPLIIEGQVIGVVYFNLHEKDTQFHEEDMNFAKTLASSVSLALQNVKLYEEVHTELAIRSQLEEELTQQKRQLEAILENMAEGLYITDKYGKPLLINHTGRKQGNFALINKDGRAVGERYFYLDGREIPEEEMPTAQLETRKKVLGMVVNRKYRGKNEYFNINATPVMDENGDFLIGVTCSSDITELTHLQQTEKEIQKQLLLAEKDKNEALERAIDMKDDFLSLISHEFKTPITVIDSALQAIEFLCKNELSDKAKGFLNKIRQNSLRQLRLVNNLLDITRVNSGHIRVYNKNIDLVFLTKAIIDSVFLFSQQKNIKILFKSTFMQKVIGIDDEKYERVLLNLLSNAIKFSEPNKTVLVEISQKNGNIAVKVKDEGLGIPPEKQEVIFERFGQVDSSLSRQAEGSGIGLSLVKKFVEACEGTICVNSKPGKGSTFTILYPDRKAPEEAEAKQMKGLTDNRLIQAAKIEFSDIYL